MTELSFILLLLLALVLPLPDDPEWDAPDVSELHP
jgi:hypothetical protein